MGLRDISTRYIVTSVTKLALLGLLIEQPLHGYELRKRVSEVLGPLSRLSFGSLYPALRKLEAEGAVRAIAADDADTLSDMPSTGSLSGEAAAFRTRRRSTRGRRNKKVYAITDAGRALFAELLAEPIEPDDDRGFALKLAFSGHLSPDARLRMLERRRAQLLERLEEARAAVSAGLGRLDSYRQSIVEHDTESAESDVAWLERLIEAERAADQAPDPASDPVQIPSESPEPSPTPTPGGAIQ